MSLKPLITALMCLIVVVSMSVYTVLRSTALEQQLYDAQHIKYVAPWFQNQGQSKVYDISCYTNTCEVFLSSHIEEQSEYSSLAKLLETAPKDSIINIHLAGNGGSTDTVLYIQNAVELSLATVNTIIDGPVYSAHAYLALIGKHIKIGPNVFFMFHEPAVQVETPEGLVNLTKFDACNLVRGLSDRNQSAYQKCLDQDKFYSQLIATYFNDYVNKYLTKQEIMDIADGKDVYISGGDMQRRINNNKGK